MKCPKCKKQMQEAGFQWINKRYLCNCGLGYVPFLERYFGNNFLGLKWFRWKR